MKQFEPLHDCESNAGLACEDGGDDKILVVSAAVLAKSTKPMPSAMSGGNRIRNWIVGRGVE